MNAQLKSFLLLLVNLVLNGSIWAFVSPDYKIWVLLVANLIQVAISFYDPSYVLQRLGWTKERYLGALENKKWGKEA